MTPKKAEWPLFNPVAIEAASHVAYGDTRYARYRSWDVRFSQRAFGQHQENHHGRFDPTSSEP